ncbi:MAG: DNA recombination protein RmuC [Proteobacteria bacterium]|nr:DNA recombination protein RmuC [Pseudomonadota bacterium]
MTWMIPFLAGLAAGLAVLAILWSSWRAKRQLLEERLSDAQRSREESERAIADLKITFKGISSEVLKETRDEFLKQAEPRISEHTRPLATALERYERAIAEIEGKREKAYGGISSMLEMLKQGQASLTRETGSLVSALKSPTARGKWGEVTLERVVEVAGMSRYCDFDKQREVAGPDSKQRPDLVVRLPRGRSVVVDAKVPLTDYMRAMEATDEGVRQSAIAAHAKAVREHMRLLGQKNYWAQFDPTPDFVVLFLPGESFFSAALEKDRDLIEDGMQSRVVLATPTTLIVMLRSVAMSWQQEQLAENSQKISEAGKDLFERCSTFARHLNSVGRGLETAIKSYNSAVGSWESRVIPGARTLKELGAVRSPDAALPEVEPLQTIPRELAGSTTEG